MARTTTNGSCRLVTSQTKVMLTNLEEETMTGDEEDRRPNEGQTSEGTSFRRLVEDQISVDEYVRRVEERIRERRVNEETPRRSADTAAQLQRRR